MSIHSVSSHGLFQAYSANKTEKTDVPGNFSRLLAAAQTPSGGAAQAEAPGKKVPAPVQAAAVDAVVGSDAGSIALDFDDYFTPKPFVDLDKLPLLLPSAKTIDALAAHAGPKFRDFLAAHAIPAAPSEITYDTEGKIQFPEGYAHADALRAALEDDPALDRELRTLNAIISAFAGMQESAAFSQEYSAASTAAEAAAVVQKYSYLFSNSQRYAAIALEFLPDGTLSPTADGKPYNPQTYRQNILA
ncbi:MAG: hypothetical protein SFW64_08970 [Alphaproteobacteria bacterium]|nr:hypothetical protein [Alphaproteobacteria bacterium]